MPDSVSVNSVCLPKKVTISETPYPMKVHKAQILAHCAAFLICPRVASSNEILKKLSSELESVGICWFSMTG